MEVGLVTSGEPPGREPPGRDVSKAGGTGSTDGLVHTRVVLGHPPNCEVVGPSVERDRQVASASGSPIRVRNTEAIAGGSETGVSRPARPFSSSSGMPPTAVATTAQPTALASPTVSGHGSARVAVAKMSACSSKGRGVSVQPTRCTQRSRPRSVIMDARRSRSGPAPTMLRCQSGNSGTTSANAVITSSTAFRRCKPDSVTTHGRWRGPRSAPLRVSRGEPSAPLRTLTTFRRGYPRDTSNRRSASLTATTTLPSRMMIECLSNELCTVVIIGTRSSFAIAKPSAADDIMCACSTSGRKRRAWASRAIASWPVSFGPCGSGTIATSTPWRLSSES